MDNRQTSQETKDSDVGNTGKTYPVTVTGVQRFFYNVTGVNSKEEAEALGWRWSGYLDCLPDGVRLVDYDCELEIADVEASEPWLRDEQDAEDELDADVDRLSHHGPGRL